jgi:triacylglycerol lipase
MISRIKLIKSLFILCLFLSNTLVSADQLRECVILLHGMGRTERSMSKIEDRLQDEGYLVWNQRYASTKDPIAILSASAVGEGLDFCAHKQTNKIHFVTHSLGGILVRHYLQDHHIDTLGRIVMLAPPNQGSEVVDALDEYGLYAYFMGPAGMALGTDPGSLPNQLKPISGEIGIISGASSSDPWFSPIIPGVDDGKVSVERTKLAEMSDFIVVDSGHTFIMRDAAVINQIVTFLRDGRFHPQVSSPDSSDYEGR